jgi:fucose permease
MKKLSAIVALLCVFGLGMSFAILGSVSVDLMERLEITKGQFGSLVSIFMISCLVMSLVVGVLVDVMGHKPLAIAGFIVAAIAFFLVGLASSMAIAIIAVLLMGFGAMALNTTGNTLIPVVLFEGKNPAAASNFGNVFFGLGLFITPLILAWLFKSRPDAYTSNVAVVAVIILIPVILAIIAQYPKVSAGFEPSQSVSLLGQIAVIIAGLTLFLYIALEASLTNWVVPYGKELIMAASPELEEKAAGETARYMMSAFAIAMMVGRLVASQVKSITKIGDKVVAAMALISAIVIFVMMKSQSVALAWVLVILIGLAFAPCFPTIVGVTFAKFKPRVYGSIFGIIFAVGLAGAVIIPKLIGNLSEGKTVQASLGVLIVVSVALLIFALLLGGVKGKGDVAAEATEPAAESAPPSGEGGGGEQG